MKQLYKTITEQLNQIPELKWIDFDAGQLYEEKPSVAYIDLPRCEDIGEGLQRIHASFTVRLAFKALGETNTKAPEQYRSLALQYFDVVSKVERQLHGYRSGFFYPFSRKSVKNEHFKRGVKVVTVNFVTAWNAHISKT